MRIAFLGKGGSGKTTMAAAFATYLHENKKLTLLVDADINAHINSLIGIEDTKLKPISKITSQIIDYVKGSRIDVKDIPFISHVPPSKQSRFITLKYNDEFLNQNVVSNVEGLRLMTIGTYEDSDVGFTCYHSKIDSFVIFLNHLLDKSDEYLVVDSVTGVDNLGNSLIFSYDLNVILVEPNYKSIEVYNNFVEGVRRLDFPVNVCVIGNKVETKHDRDLILNSIKNDKHLIGFVSKSNKLKLVDQGNKMYFKEFIYENSNVFDQVLKTLDSIQRDWDIYLKNIRSSFSYMARNYYNQYYGIDLESKIDNSFSFKDVI